VPVAAVLDPWYGSSLSRRIGVVLRKRVEAGAIVWEAVSREEGLELRLGAAAALRAVARRIVAGLDISCRQSTQAVKCGRAQIRARTDARREHDKQYGRKQNQIDTEGNENCTKYQE
jgi:hypothetical protein